MTCLAKDPNEEMVQLALKGDIPGVKKLLDSGVNVNYGNKVRGVFPTMCRVLQCLYRGHNRCLHNQLRCCCLLSLTFVRSICMRTQNGKYSALIMACRAQQVDMVKFLLERGASINYKSEVGPYARVAAENTILAVRCIYCG